MRKTKNVFAALRHKFFPGILCLLHLYIGLRLVPALPTGLPGQAAVTLLLIASCALLPFGFRARQIRSKWLLWPALLSIGFFSWLLLFTVLRDVALGIAALLSTGPLPAALPGDSAIAVLGLTLLVTIVGLIMARKVARVVTVDVPLPALPRALHGFTIVQLSDIHIGPTIKQPYLAAVVERVNRLNPDMVAITGDLVDGTVQELAPHMAPLARLSARYGTYFVTGNHEYYSGAPGWIDALRKLNVNVLLNEHVVLDHQGAPLVVAGITDYTAHHYIPAHKSDPRAALAGAPANSPRVLLAHQPRSATEAASAGYDLQLSGHTHGGQFWPWNLFVPLQQPFVAGLNKLGRLWVYTSRGTGYWGPPMRFGAPSEITLLRLVSPSA
jgi:uncharacterized protein